MKLKSIYLIGFFLFILISCIDQQDFWDISQFNIDNNALEDHEEIKIIYNSSGPDYNQDQEYYFHLIAVSQKTGDTVNILTPSNHGIKKSDNNKIFVFFKQNHIISKLNQLDAENLKNLDKMQDLNEDKNIDKVVRDPEFDYIADNNHPAIIGSVGTISKE